MKRIERHSFTPRRFSIMNSTPNPTRDEDVQKAGDYWRIFFFVKYLLCFCPFRFKKIPKDDPRHPGKGSFYTTTSWLPQRFVCVIVDIAALFGIIGEIRLSIPRGTNPSEYFQMAQTLAFSLGKFLILKRYWMDKEMYVNMLNHIMSTEIGTLRNMTFRRKLVCSRYSFVAVCVIYFLNEIGYYVIGLDAGTTDRSDESEKASMWDQMLADARFNFLFLSKAVEKNATIAHGPTNGTMDDSDTLYNIGLGALACLGYYQRIIMGSFDNMYVLAANLTSWTFVTSFISMVEIEHESFANMRASWAIDREYDLQQMIFTISKNHLAKRGTHGFEPGNVRRRYPDEDWWPEFFTRYKFLKSCTNQVNDLYGVNIAMIMIETIVFFATSFATLFIGKANLLKTVVMFIVCCMICGGCILSADITHKMMKVRNWLSLPHNRKCIPSDELQYVLDDLDNSNVSIKAMRAYAITYSQLASMAATSITYFIICLGI